MWEGNVCLCKKCPVPAGTGGARELLTSLEPSFWDPLCVPFLLSLRVLSGFLAAFVCLYVGRGGRTGFLF